MSSSYLRFPDLHADLVTFVAEDDVWVASLDGGRAWRISSMQLPARNPRFSPDGATIAWSVVQGSAPEVVAADTTGGDFRQLTYWGNQATRVRGFSPNGNAIAISPFEHEDFRLRWAYEVPLDGSAPVALPYGPVDSVAYGPAVGDERPVVVGSVMTREPAWWKRYRGGTAGKLWIDGDGNGEFERLAPELDGNLTDPMWIDGRVVFLSDHEGYGNLYSVTPQGTELRRHTDFSDFYVRHASSDGHRIVFEAAGELWLLPSLDDDARRLPITLGSAGTGRRPKPLDPAAHLAAVKPDAEGTASVLETHGTLHWLTHRDGPSRVIEADSAVRARLGRPLAGGRAVYVADFGGEEALYVRDVFADHQVPGAGAVPAAPAARTLDPVHSSPADDDSEIPLPRPVSAATGTPVRVSEPVSAPAIGHEPDADDAEAPAPAATTADAEPESSQKASDRSAEGPTRRISFDKPTRVAQITASPDGTAVAVSTEYGEVYLLDPERGTLTRVAAAGHGAVDQLAFSADSAWLAWSEPVTAEAARSRIRLQHVTEPDAAPIDVTDGRFRDHSPSFTVDGRYLAFLSERSFDPVYDTHRFDLSFPSSTKPFLVALAADTPSPFGPSVHGLPVPRAEQVPVKSDDPAESVPAGPASEVDAAGIQDRIIAVPVPQGRYEKLTAADGSLLWLASDTYGVTGDGRASTSERSPASRLERFDLEKKDVSVLVPALVDYEVSGDGRKVVYVHEQQVHAVPSSARADADSPDHVTVDLGRIRVQLEPLKVWGQEFDEAWRLQRDFFWAPDMGGLDWDGVHARYRPLVQNLGSHDDLVDLLWEMHGELGTSHAYVAPKPTTEPGAGAQGFLGADLRPGPGGWEVVRILAAESSDPQAVSPLAAPGADVHPGDIIAAVDGRPVPAGQGPAPLLANAAGRTVELTVIRGSGDAAPRQRRIAVVPLRSEERLRYQNWVTTNRSIVREASNGGFGYLHIPDMVANGWSQLHRDLDQESSRNALIVDVRRNRGGHTSQLVAELIGRKVSAWTMARGEQPTTYPAHAPRGPVVILTDEFAGSDGDIITQVAKLRGIGPVIGMRTWGGVVGIDGRFKLVDGTGVNQPRYGFWMTGGIGWSVENYGVDPDIEVPFPPHAYAAGEDPQLEHGVGILKEMLSELPTDQPPALAGYPSLVPAPLPQRPQADTTGQPGGQAAARGGLPGPVGAAGSTSDREAGRH